MATTPSEITLLESSARIVTTRHSDHQRAIVWRIWDSVYGAVSAHAPTIILLHGSYGSWTHWLRNIPALASVCRVVAVDIPGFGDSDAPSADLMPPDMARSLGDGWAQLLDEVPAMGRAISQPLFIAGFSLGAIYAGWLTRCLLSDRRPGHPVPSGLILLGPGGLGNREANVFPVRSVARKGGALLAEQERLAVHRHNLAVLMFADPERIDDVAVLVQDVNVSRARFRGPFTSRSDYLAEALHGVTLPVLGIWGDRDAFDLDVYVRVQALCSVAPQAEVRIIQGVGHWVGYEAPEQVNSTIIDWMVYR